MKCITTIICFVLSILLVSCIWANPNKRIEDMKNHIPDLGDIIENNAESLETLLTIQSQIGGLQYNFFNRNLAVVYDLSKSNANESASYTNQIAESSIADCDYLTESDKITIEALLDALPEAVIICINSDSLAIRCFQNEYRDTAIYLSNVSMDYDYKSGSYCEQLDETWYAHILYAPLA